MVTEIDGSCVVAWTDYRPGADPAIYLQRIDGQGILGLPVSGVEAPLIPRAVALRQNVPNPFNPSTVITFDLPRAEAVRLVVYDLAGRLVRELHNGDVLGPGRLEAAWDGRNDMGRLVPAGVYLYCLDADSLRKTKAMMLVK